MAVRLNTIPESSLHLIDVIEVVEMQLFLKRIDYGRLVTRNHTKHPKIISFILGHDKADAWRHL